MNVDALLVVRLKEFADVVLQSSFMAQNGDDEEEGEEIEDNVDDNADEVRHRELMRSR